MIVNKYTKGGSSSGGTGSVVSWRQDLSAGTQIGQITINGQAQSVFAPEGGGSENYQIVDNISEVQNPQAGTKVYVHSGSTVETYSGVAFDASTVSEGYVVKVFDGQGNNYFDIYRSGDNFFWDWENDGDVHSRTANGKLFYYKSDTTNHIFYLFPADTATTLDFQEMGEGVTTGDTSTGVTITWEAQSLMYTGSEYVSTSDVIYDLDSMTQSEIAALNAYLNSASEIERVGAHIYKDRNKCRYDRIENSKAGFECHYIASDEGFAYIKNYIFFIKPDGTFEYADNGSEYGIPATFAVNYSAHTLTSTNVPIWAAARGIRKGVVPVVYLLSGTTGVAVAKDAYIEVTGDWTGIIGATFEYSGETIDAKWSYNENTATLISWNTGGGGDSKTIVNIDALSQSELVVLYNTLSGATSADSINEHYEFYYTFYDSPYNLTEGPIRLQFLYPQGSCVTFGASCYDGQYQNIVAYSIRLNSDGTYDYYFDKIDKTFGLQTQRIFRDYWYVYYDTTTSGFSYGVDQELTPITWGTGNTCSGEWIFDRDATYQYLGSPIKSERALYFNLRVKTAEGTRIYGYPSFSRVVLDTPVTFTNEQSESVSFTDKVYFDYGDCVLSFYFNNDWRFGGMQITFR